MCGSEANFQRQYAQMPAEMLHIVRQLAKSRTLGTGQELADCPACASPGVAGGNHDVDWHVERDEDGVPHATGTVWFFGYRFACGVCGLRLDSPAELAGANMEADWKVEGADPAAYDLRAFDEDAAYEAWREEQREREERDEEESHAAYEAWREEQHEREEEESHAAYEAWREEHERQEWPDP